MSCAALRDLLIVVSISHLIWTIATFVYASRVSQLRAADKAAFIAYTKSMKLMTKQALSWPQGQSHTNEES